MKRYSFLARFLSAVVVFLFLCGCAGRTDGPAGTDESDASAALFSLEQSDLTSGQSSIEEPGRPAEDSVQTGLIAEQILEGETGEIHYSYYLPEDYREDDAYPMIVVMPGYDMMWFGEESSGSNLDWRGFLCWTELSKDIIVVSAQLTDWRETSARQAIELTEYFLTNFSVDESRVYAAGYSAGGETMSRAVSMRPDLYAAYLHGASQWDGEFDPIAENGVAVYRRKMMNITVRKRRGTPIPACTPPTKTPDGRSGRSTRCCNWKFRITNILMNAASPGIITAAGMSCLRTDPF